MGTYVYLLSRKLKSIKIDGSKAEIGSYIYSHKRTFDGPKGLTAARMAKNEIAWGAMDFPTYVTHSSTFEDTSGPFFYHSFDRMAESPIWEDQFKLLAGTIEREGRSFVGRKYHTLFCDFDLLEDQDFDVQVASAQARANEMQRMRELIPSGLTLRTQEHRVFEGSKVYQRVFFHSHSLDALAMVKMVFDAKPWTYDPNAKPSIRY